MTGEDSGSQPCFAHELRQLDDGTFVAEDEETRRDVMRWRKSERERLIAARLAVSVADREAWSAAITSNVASACDFSKKTVSFYWPFRGEPDLRPLMQAVLDAGGTCALPVVVEKARPLVFRAWKPGETLERGVWNIPVPPDTAPEVRPDIVISPVVGFDPAAYRLGYGGGYYDRTLATFTERPLVVGVGPEIARIPTIFPQAHDIPMSMIVTENGIAVTSER